MRTELEVVRQAIVGHSEAQENLFSSDTTKLYGAAFSILRNREDAEDALQDGLLQAYTGLRSFEGRSSFSTWLTRVVINAALMARRKNRAHPEDSLDEILDRQPEGKTHSVVDPCPGPEEVCAANEISGFIERHLRQLPKPLENAFRLHTTGLSTAESSDLLRINRGAFKSRVSRAKRKLAQELQQTLATSVGA
jgi:RNA polymerase sigma-70 factor (ECF subfamily)